MQMMYEIIYMALKEVGLDDKYEPQDYLNFFCLGNREADNVPSASSEPFSDSNPQVKLQAVLQCFPADCCPL
jgi:phospholipase D1/2